MSGQIEYEDEADAAGFTIMPNIVLLNDALTMQARMTYSLLAHYARQKGSCFPGRRIMAEHLGVSERSVGTYIVELEGAGLVRRVQRGQGKTCRYVMLSLSQPGSVLPVKPGSLLPVKPGSVLPTEEEAVKKKVMTNVITQEDQISDVWEHYVATMKPRRKTLDPDERKIIRAALEVASVEELKLAIDGCAASDFHMGRDVRTNGKRYNTLSQIVKPKRASAQGSGYTLRERVDFFIDLVAGKRNGVPSADAEKLSRAKRALMDAWEFPGDEKAQERGRMSALWLAEHGYKVERGDSGVPKVRAAA